MGVETKALQESIEKTVMTSESVVQFNLGLCYEHGIGVSKDLWKSKELYTLASNGGCGDATYTLAEYYQNNKSNTKRLREKARKLYRLASNQGNAAAQYTVGLWYQYGEGVDKDLLKAVELYTLASNQGYADAQSQLGFYYGNHDGVDKNLLRSVELYTLASNQGHANAQYNLGVCYSLGLGVDKNLEKSTKFYRLASDKGLAVAQAALATCYLFGNGVVKDTAKHDALLAQSKTKQVVMNVCDPNKIENLRQFVELWMSSNIHDNAQCKLGNSNEAGIEITQDLKKAIEFYILFKKYDILNVEFSETFILEKYWSKIYEYPLVKEFGQKTISEKHDVGNRLRLVSYEYWYEKEKLLTKILVEEYKESKKNLIHYVTKCELFLEFILQNKIQDGKQCIKILLQCLKQKKNEIKIRIFRAQMLEGLFFERQNYLANQIGEIQNDPECKSGYIYNGVGHCQIIIMKNVEKNKHRCITCQLKLDEEILVEIDALSMKMEQLLSVVQPDSTQENTVVEESTQNMTSQVDPNTALLIQAIIDGNLKKMNRIIGRLNPNFNVYIHEVVPDKEMWTLLHLACEIDHEEIFDTILEHCLSILDEQNGDGNTALHLAIINNNLFVASRLLNIGADPSIQNDDGDTPESLAIAINDESILELFGRKSAPVLAPIDSSSSSNMDFGVSHEAEKPGSQTSAPPSPVITQYVNMHLAPSHKENSAIAKP